jgi:tetratricopeptide (TPR) repeat protein
MILFMAISFFSCSEIIRDDKEKNNFILSKEWCKKGIKLFKEGEYEQSIKLFEKAIENDPLYFQAWHNKSIALQALNKNDEALAANQKAIELMIQKEKNEQDFEVWYLRGLLLSLSAQYYDNIANEIDAYDKALEINPNALKVLTSKGFVLKEMGRYDEAMDTYDQAIKVDAGYDYIWVCKGEILFILKQYREAILAYEQAIKINKNGCSAWQGKYKALKALGDIGEADKALLRIKSLEGEEQEE